MLGGGREGDSVGGGREGVGREIVERRGRVLGGGGGVGRESEC